MTKWKLRGSSLVEDDRTPTAPAKPPVVVSYDPSEHTVEEVKSYVTDHPKERANVLAAEEDGKARVTLVEWLDSEET